MSLMNRFMDRFFGAGPAGQAEQRSDAATAEWLALMGAPGNRMRITTDNALTIAAVYACVRVLAESVASLPLKLYRRNGTSKDVATDHRLYQVLHDMANPEMTSFEFREAMMHNLLLYGNAYAEIELSNRADVLGLWPKRPDWMEIQRDRDTGELVYVYREPGRPARPISAYRMFHVRGLSSNGIVGYSPIAVARRTLNLAAATETFGLNFFENGAQIGTTFKHPGKLSDQAYKRLQGSIQGSYAGADNAHKFMIIEEGMDVTRAGIPPEDAQFLETRKYTRSEIAGLYRVPPHMIGDLDRATFSNIEHQSLDYVINSLRPWLVRWEQAIGRALIGEMERKTIFAEFNVDGLLRGDIASRYTAYATGRNWGWLSVNDIRALENLNPVESGDVYLQPLNMTPAGEPAPTQPPPPEGEGSNTQRAVQLLVQDACKRIEQRAGDRDEKHRAWVADVIRPLVRAIGRDTEGEVESDTEALAAWWFSSKPALTGDELAMRLLADL
jgi:HK97 family phage portal protein